MHYKIAQFLYHTDDVTVDTAEVCTTPNGTNTGSVLLDDQDNTTNKKNAKTMEDDVIASTDADSKAIDDVEAKEEEEAGEEEEEEEEEEERKEEEEGKMEERAEVVSVDAITGNNARHVEEQDDSSYEEQAPMTDEAQDTEADSSVGKKSRFRRFMARLIPCIFKKRG